MGYFLAGKAFTDKQKDFFFPWSELWNGFILYGDRDNFTRNTVLHVHTYGQIISLFGSDFYDTQYQTVVLCHLQKLPLVNHSPINTIRSQAPILIDTFILGLLVFGKCGKKGGDFSVNLVLKCQVVWVNTIRKGVILNLITTLFRDIIITKERELVGDKVIMPVLIHYINSVITYLGKHLSIRDILFDKCLKMMGSVHFRKWLFLRIAPFEVQ